jgi:hypothetical protein
VKASELVAALQAAIAEHGDWFVELMDDGQAFDVEDVSIDEKAKRFRL